MSFRDNETFRVLCRKRRAGEAISAKVWLVRKSENEIFPEGGAITLNKWRNSDELRDLLNELNSEEMQAM